MRHFLDFEKPIASLEGKVEELRHMSSDGSINIQGTQMFDTILNVLVQYSVSVLFQHIGLAYYSNALFIYI